MARIGPVVENGLDPVDAAYLLSTVVPRLVTTEINPAASRGTLQGGLLDLLERMRSALPCEVEISKAQWLEMREKDHPPSVLQIGKTTASSFSSSSTTLVATIPREGRMRAGAVTSNGVISLLDGR